MKITGKTDDESKNTAPQPAKWAITTGIVIISAFFWAALGGIYYYLAPDFGLPRLGPVKISALMAFVILLRTLNTSSLKK